MLRDDLIRLQHMLDAAREAAELAAGKSRHDIENERTLNLLINLTLVNIKDIHYGNQLCFS